MSFTKSIIIFLLFPFLNISAQDDEISLFDSQGTPIAYIAIEEDFTIYYWDGKPTAYLAENNGDVSIYNFDGEHLGWFEDGLILDHGGYVVGFVHDAVNMVTKLEALKGLKQLKPIKGLREISPIKPLIIEQWSNIPLTIFFLEKINKSKLDDIIVSNIAGSFNGLEGETIIKLDNGQVWQQNEYYYHYHYAYRPEVVIFNTSSGYKIKIEGIEKIVRVKQVSRRFNSQKQTPFNQAYIESYIDGDFEGFDGDTIIKLGNGQIWQQSEYYYYYHYAFMPKVFIIKADYGYKIKVEGIDKLVGVKRLK